MLHGAGNTRKYYVGAKVELPVAAARRARFAALQAQHDYLRTTISQAEFAAVADLPQWMEQQTTSRDLKPAVVSALAKPQDRRTEADNHAIREAFLKTRPEVAEPREELAKLAKRMKTLAPPTTLIMADKPGAVQSYVLKRGQIGSRGKAVVPGTPATLHALDPGLPSNRLGLAQWITAPENPLTARVTVNRVWAEMFGRGIVTSVDDFGRQGAAPTHPDLLDWLAVEFVEQGWSIKHIVRLIVNSSTYRQSSRRSPDLLERDPHNRLVASGPRFRLPAEAIRDAVLAASGLLSLKLGGPPVRPAQPAGLWREISTATDPDYETSQGEDRHRRGIYTFMRRGAPYPSYITFDASPRQDCVALRARTNSPLQALTLLNDPVYVEAANALAKLVTAQPLRSDADRLAYAFRCAVTREPTALELQRLMVLLSEFRETSGDASQAWVSLARVLLNLDETITKS